MDLGGTPDLASGDELALGVVAEAEDVVIVLLVEALGVGLDVKDNPDRRTLNLCTNFEIADKCTFWVQLPAGYCTSRPTRFFRRAA